MKLYEVDVGGATYWCAADNAPQAMRAMLECWKNEGCDDDDVDYAAFDDITDTDRAQILTVRDDDTGPAVRMIVEARNATEPKVIACSEWP